MDEARRLALLTSARSATLGTVTAEGAPHLVPCCFVVADRDGSDCVYSAIDGKPKSTTALRRLANISANPTASLLVDQFDEDWTALWWVRVDGPARVIDPAARDGAAEYKHAIDLLVDKYPQYHSMRPTGPVVAIDIAHWRAWAAA